jgi:hypothetical protein
VLWVLRGDAGQRALQAAMNGWRQRGAPYATGSQILIDENRRFNRELWTRLLSERDDRRVRLEE